MRSALRGAARCVELRSVLDGARIGTRIGTAGECGLDDVTLARVRAVVGVALGGSYVSVPEPLLERAHRYALRGERGAVAVPQGVEPYVWSSPAPLSASLSRSYMRR